ncbi:hypothetical protein ABV409_15500 [Flagellimonas sp. DF-77]|uniref:CBM96 family carbohydrate-binding protein n=1 Tax=Flagellimonas algarum TaxID=3230298 RepID=UPI003395069D
MIFELFLVFALLLGCSKDSDLFNEIVLGDDEEVVQDGGTDNDQESTDETEDEPQGDLELRSVVFYPTNDAYIQSSDGFNETVIKLRENLRTSYLMFDLREIDGDITNVEFRARVQNDPGDGIINVYKGNDNGWTEEDLAVDSAPVENELLGLVQSAFHVGEAVSVDLQTAAIESGIITLVVKHEVGNDLALASKENSEEVAPRLIVEYMTSPDSPQIESTFVEEEATDSDQEEEAEEEATGEDPGSAPCDYGGDCMFADTGCFDSSYPTMQEWANAGVNGGIPSNLTVVRTINTSNNLQAIINDVHSNGGGVILMTEGTYSISQTLMMKSNVVLRGVDKESVIIESTVRGDGQTSRSIYFDNVSNAGIENLTHFYRVDNCQITDRQELNDGAYDSNLFQNDPCGLTNIRVNAIEMDRSSSNNWIDNCNILESGSHPIDIEGDHNTVRNCFIDRAYNKGPGGRGYVVTTGVGNLFVGNVIKRIRHFIFQRGAKYNVAFKNTLWVDMNFHSEDGGFNLVEQNTITTPSWHAWPIIETGREGVPGHEPPGPNNFIYNNLTNHRQTGEQLFGAPGVIYTIEGFENVFATNWSEAGCSTFYAVSGN